MKLFKGCRFRSIAIFATVLASGTPHFAVSQQEGYSLHGYGGGSQEGAPQTNEIQLASINSDEYAETVLTVTKSKASSGFGLQDHATITTILSTTRELIDSAAALIQDRRTLKEGQTLMECAHQLFRDVKDHIRQRNEAAAVDDPDDQRKMLRQKYSDHDIDKAQHDDERGMDVVRELYNTMITFPECMEQLLNTCLNIINDEIGELGLATIEVVVHEKRNADQEGYNKVVIVTNALGDQVKGRAGDGVVTYPFMWHDEVLGQRLLGASGAWGCLGETPENCCKTIKASVPNVDIKKNNIECHIFVPFGGVTNMRRSDRVFVNLSPDGRVQEAPIIQ